MTYYIYINDITGNIQSNIRLFADDCIEYHQDNSCKLQNDISSLLRCAETWQMRFNSKKCHIRNKSSPVYYLGTDVLSTVSSHTYLGITVSSDLKWHEHISNICLYETRTLNFVRHNTYFCSQEAKKSCLCVLSSSPLGVCRCSMGSVYGQRYPATRTSSTLCCPFCQIRLLSYNLCQWSARRTWLVALVQTSQTLSFDGFCRAMLCIARLLPSPSVCPSRSWIRSKRINISSKFFHHMVATPF